MIINITIKQIVYDSTIEAISEDYYETTSKLDLPFNNNKPNLIFDLLSRNIRDKADDNIKLIPVKRSSREFYIIYNKKEKYIYSIMNYNSFKNNLPKYSEALLKKYNVNISLQKELFEFNEPNIKYNLIVNEILKNVDNEIRNNIDRYCIVVYHVKRDNLILLKNYILDKNLDEYKIENWLTDDTIKPNPIILDNNIKNIYNDNTRLKLKKKSENILIEKGIINEPIVSKNNIKDNKENKEVENE